jgi:DNA-binding NarL/FixJ family response regulator
VGTKRIAPRAHGRPLKQALGRDDGAMTAPDAAVLRANLRHLTPRQRDIVRLLGHGRSSASIAAALGVTTSAVTAQRARIRHLLGLGTEWELTRYAILATLAVEASSRRSRLR